MLHIFKNQKQQKISCHVHLKKSFKRPLLAVVLWFKILPRTKEEVSIQVGTSLHYIVETMLRLA